MTIREIPKAYEYICDKCGEKHLQQNASGHYTNSTPPQWYRLTINGDFYKYPSFDGVPHRLLCRPCGDGIRKVLNDYDLRV